MAEATVVKDLDTPFLQGFLQNINSADWHWEAGEQWYAELRSALKLIDVDKKSDGGRARLTASFEASPEERLHFYLSGGVANRVELYLSESVDCEAMTDAQYDDVRDVFFAKYRSTVATVQAVFGKPKFNNGFGNRGFPDENAEWAAVWESKKGRILVLQQHEGRDLPFYICVVLDPGKG